MSALPGAGARSPSLTKTSRGGMLIAPSRTIATIAVANFTRSRWRTSLSEAHFCSLRAVAAASCDMPAACSRLRSRTAS